MRGQALGEGELNGVAHGCPVEGPEPSLLTEDVIGTGHGQNVVLNLLDAERATTGGHHIDQRVTGRALVMTGAPDGLLRSIRPAPLHPAQSSFRRATTRMRLNLIFVMLPTF